MAGDFQGNRMQIAATICRTVQYSEDDFRMRATTFIFSDKDTVEYMLKATGQTDVGALNLSRVAADSEYHS